MTVDNTKDIPVGGAERLSGIVELQRALSNTSFAADQAMQEVVGRVRHMLGADAATIETIDGKQWVCRAASGDSLSVGIRRPWLLNAVSQTLRSGGTVCSEDVQTDPLFDQKSNLAAEVRSALAVGFRDESGVAGAILAVSHRKAAFDSGDARCLEIAAGMLSTAMQRSHSLEKLRHSELMFQNAFEYAAIGIALVAPEGRWLRVNKSLCTMLGLSADELLELNFQAITHPDDLEADLNQVRDVLDGVIDSYSMEKRYFHKRGHIVWVLLSVSLVRDAGGAPLYFISQIQDITARKHAEEALRESCVRNGFALAGSGLGVWDCNLVTSDAHYDEQLAAMLGYDVDEIEPTFNGWANLIHPEDRPAVMEQVEAHLRGETAFYETEHRLRTKSGDWKWIADRGMIVEWSDDGTPLRATGTHREIDKEKRAELTLQRARLAAEEANRAKSDFLANMSHEIRTPMAAILGYAEVAAESASDPDQLRAIDTIRRNGEHLLEIINDILDLSKIEAGKLVLHQRRCSPFQTLEEVVSLMQIRAEEKGLTLQTHVEPPIPTTIRTDPTRLRQILINLIGNAIKFTDSGHVAITMIVSESSRPQLHFEIRDTGIGMNAEQIAGLFQPFGQVDPSATRRYGGAGLGLAISKRLISRLGGEIEVESRPDRGSNFHFWIETGPLDGVPMLASCAGVSADRTPVAPAGKTALPRARILLVEDSADNQRLIRYYLESAGADVEIAGNGRQAIDRILDDKVFSLVLMDMQMPVMDGKQATQILRERGFQTPIIALTAHAMEGEREKCLSYGCNDYLAKPIRRDELLRSVAGWLPHGSSAG